MSKRRADLPRLDNPSRRRFIAAGAGAAGIALLGLSACSDDASSTSGSGGSGDELHGLSHYIATVTSLESGDRGFKHAVEQLGGSFEHESYAGDQQELMSQAQLFSSLGVNGAFGYIVSDALVDPYVTQLAASNIRYVNMGNRVPWLSPLASRFNGLYVAHMNGSFAEDGYVVGKILFERGGGEGQAILLKGAPGVADDARTFGFNLALEEYPGVEVVAEAVTNWDRAQAQEAAEALLSSHRDVRFVVGYNDSIALGALASARALNRDDVLLCGVDGDPEMLSEMVDDERVVSTAAARIDFLGTLGAVLLFDNINGVERNPLESMLDVDSIVMDSPGSAQAMLDVIGEAPDPLPYDATKMSRFLAGDDWAYPHRVRIANPIEFDWGDRPGVNPTETPSDADWPDEYQEALDAGDLDTLNAEYEAHLDDIYGPVREAANFTGQGVFGAFDELGIT